MKSAIMFQIESDDSSALSEARIGEIQHLMANFITPEDQGGTKGHKPHPGYRAMGVIKGRNPFSAEDVVSFAGYVDELLSRHAEALTRLEIERNEGDRNDFDRKAYDHLASSMKAQAATVRQIRDGFVEAFEDERQQAPRL